MMTRGSFFIYKAFLVIEFLYSKVNITTAKAEDEAHSTQLGEYGTDWVLFPDDDGNLYFVNISSNPSNLSDTVYSDTDVHFQLYTRNNPYNYENLLIEDDDENNSSADDDKDISNFATDKPVKFLSHGFLSNGDSSTVIDMKGAYLNVSDVNIVIIDWGELAKPPYISAVINTRFVGQQVGKMVRTLMKRYSLTGRDFQIVGHSLGGHVAGYAGRWLSGHNMTIARLTGLDPARPCFEISCVISTDSIKADDADFVDIIHTNAHILGVVDPHGVADFYPNGGGPYQTGCGITGIIDACSHGRSHIYFTESILTGGFVARQCDSWSSYKAGDCDNNEASNMGQHNSDTARGNYYLHTNPESPYSKKEDSE